MTASGDGLWFATRQAVIQYIAQVNKWLAKTHYLEWGPVLAGLIGMHVLPPQECQRVVADHEGVLWAAYGGVRGAKASGTPIGHNWVYRPD